MLRLFFIGLMFLFQQNISFATTYAFCKDAEAFNDAIFSQRNPKLDYICQLKTDLELGQSAVRCPVTVKGECQENAGGEPAEGGDHNVPAGAWFRSYSTTAGQAVRCQCGCFAPDTFILNSQGRYEAIQDLLETSKKEFVSVMTRQSFDDVQSLKSGPKMRARNFTVGPENRPLVEISTAHNPKLRVTDTHPILVLKNGKQVFIRAGEVQPEDILLNDRGEEVTVLSIRSYEGSVGKNVINFMAPGKNPLSHIVMANGLQVGDNALQQIVNDKDMRLKLRLTGNLTYLTDIKGH